MKAEIIDGNKLIETFRGIRELMPNGTLFGTKRGMPKEHENWYNIIPVDDLKYHSSWDWLMPVVEKIQSIYITPAPNYTGYRIEIVVQGYVKISGFPMPPILRNVSISGSLINAVWLAVTDFIQFHNTHIREANK